MFRQIFSELKKMFSIRAVYPVILAYLFSGIICIISMSAPPEGGEITYALMIHGYCSGYILIALTLPFFMTNYIHNDYKSGIIRNMYAAWEDRRNIITVRWIAAATFLFFLQLFGMMIAVAIHIAFKTTTNGEGSVFLSHYIIYYILILHAGTLCMLFAHLLKNTTLCVLLEIIILVPFGFLTNQLRSHIPAILSKCIVVSQTYHINASLHASDEICDIIFSVIYIILMIMIMRRFAEKEDLYKS